MQIKTVAHILKVMTVKMTASQISSLSTRFLQVRMTGAMKSTEI